MFVLKKLFQLREQGSPDGEKPFLAHLDDLRVMLFRMIAVLMVAVIGAYLFREQLMDFIRRPVEQVWVQSQEAALKDLPKTPSLESWEKAVRVANDAIALTPPQRRNLSAFVAPDDADFPFHVEAASYFRVSLGIENKKERKRYVRQIPGITATMKKQLVGLVDGDPNARLDAKGRMVVMQTLNPTEGFMLAFKLAFFAGLIISFPLLLYFLMQFVLPGLHAAEKKALLPALAVGFGLFLTGAVFAYVVILPSVLNFFYEYSLELGIENDWRIGYYISFATQFVLIFGLAFELPVVVMTFVKLGILDYHMMKTTRSYAVLAIVIIAAVVTPTPDLLTLSLLAVPMYLLYELCIWLAYFIGKKEASEDGSDLPALETTPALGTAARPDDDYDNFHAITKRMTIITTVPAPTPRTRMARNQTRSDLRLAKLARISIRAKFGQNQRGVSSFV